jgi:hypothetical protein
MLTNA